MKTPMKYTFEVGNPYRRDSASHHQARCGADIYRKDPGAEQPGAAPYVTDHDHQREGASGGATTDHYLIEGGPLTQRMPLGSFL
jgi:hypothetical protein